MDYNKLTLCYCKITTDSNIILSATQLRSYIGYKFISDTEFHHHDDSPYHYPLIQYKKIQDTLCVMGINEFTDLIQCRLSGLQEIVLKNIKVSIRDIHFSKKSHIISDTLTKYEFYSPWIALNQENYTKFNRLDGQLHKVFLEKILTANLLSTLKGLDCRIEHDLYVKINYFKFLPVVAHKHGFSGFRGTFVTNLSLPEFIGIGKSVSKGFGIIRRI